MSRFGSHVCDNPECQYHVRLGGVPDPYDVRLILPTKPDPRMYVDSVAVRNDVLPIHHVRRMEYVDKNRYTIMWFCHVCHNAAEMVRKA